MSQSAFVTPVRSGPTTTPAPCCTQWTVTGRSRRAFRSPIACATGTLHVPGRWLVPLPGRPGRQLRGAGRRTNSTASHSGTGPDGFGGRPNGFGRRSRCRRTSGERVVPHPAARRPPGHRSVGGPAGRVCVLCHERGVAVGTGIAWFVTDLMSGMLYGVEAQDLATFTSVPALFATVALLACWIPAGRAARVRPSNALRYE